MAGSVFHKTFPLVCFCHCLDFSLGAEKAKDEAPDHEIATITLKFVGAAVVIIILTQLIKLYFSGGVCRSKARLNGKTAVVTGANTGIGKETALDFARRGAKVILACRDEAKANQAAKDIIAETASDKVLVRVVDLSSFESVRAFAKLINETEERLDILVNNAGLLGSYHSATEDGNEMIFQVNYLSHFLLTLLLIEKMKMSAPSRIVNVSSMGSETKKLSLSQLHVDDFKVSNQTLKFDGLHRYAESKLAQVVFTKELSRRLEGYGVTAYVLHPGVVATEIWRHYAFLQKPLLKQLLGFVSWLTFKDSRQGAQTTIYCSVSEEAASESGLYYSDCKVKENSNKFIIDDPGVAKKLWEISESLTGENWKH
ncbi:retinol dehydrogenase 13-like isoform X1 [Montipora capricornis]|uniref:retinol dehydrogenase 13-like isoform X1 n=1 Tax=Montipora capricornis TaxID=246305 RepID=UPI0035F12183